MPFKSIFPKTIDLLAHPGAVFYSCGWLMVLLVLGTVAQRYVGLFAAQNSFFYSFILWAGPVPLPGGMTTMGILTLSITLKLMFKSELNIKRAGAIISHIGALLLMVGAMITFYTAVDGAITLFPNDSSRSFTAYHTREFVALDSRDDSVIAHIPFDDIRSGTVLKIPNTPITATIISACRNCTFTARDPQKIDPDLRGRARDFDIARALLEKQDEDNKSAALFRIAGTGTDKDGVHLSADFIAVSPWIEMDDHRIHMAIRKAQHPLPFLITLNAFQRDMHPGTDMARSYESDITIHENNTSWPATIRMNEPFRYRGYTFYQSSFIADGKREGSVLAVVKNDGRAYPYIAGLIMSLGILIHFIKRITKKPRVIPKISIVILCGIFLCLSVSPSFANDTSFLSKPIHDQFAALPIQDQGRIKPIDTFARSTLETFSGRDYTDRDDAVTWLARVLFAPSTAASDPIFRIQNASVQHALSLPLAPGHRYSFNDTVAALSRTREMWMPLASQQPDDLSLPQKQILELAHNTEIYMDLARTFAHDRPDFVINNQKIADLLNVPHGTRLSSRDLHAHREELVAAMTALQKKATRMNANKKMAADEITLVDIVARMSAIDSTPKSVVFRTIPNNQDKMSEWGVPQRTSREPTSILYAQFARAVSDQQIDRQATSLTNIQNILSAHIPHTSFTIEHIFNRYAPMTVSLVLYLVSGLLACIALQIKTREKLFYAVTGGMVFTSIIALTIHLFGVVGRMIILHRPPVTNLYDSILFVGIAGVVGLLVLALHKRDILYMVLACITGALLQIIALKFDAEGDTLRVLSAVLDTNFWLSTHVVVITVGYATSIMTAMLAHTALAHRIIKPTDTARAAALYRTTNTLSFVAMFTTTVGTILGGIWADQSWGRFWGWDPKENGALLIVLWLIWVLHGRIGGIVREVGTLALLAGLNIIVAIAWFGVNLLGVGLHSYGFTESATYGLTLFCSIELALIITATFYLKSRKPIAT